MHNSHDLKGLSNRRWVINIEIPDEGIVEETINYIQNRVNETFKKADIEDYHRDFLLNKFHIVRTPNMARDVLINANENEEMPCVILAFNAALTQSEYDRFGVISFKYISWTRKMWSKAKSEITTANLLKLLKCLGRNIVDFGCQALIDILFNRLH